MCNNCLAEVDSLITRTLNGTDHLCKTPPEGVVIAGDSVYCDLLRGHEGKHFNEETGWTYR